ncbi:MAG: LuxR family transcriptional regulator [Roseibacillus sp.]|jgi:DNA-binding NarL/FixJ family response regulator|nr:LuxR family transcriptional regulator [Roseibacillus sp.]MCP4731666.1 response regulator transcription factor [Roseibacillus sp.]MDP6207683.1 response regulator transcription factor [Roseibacillus sp.]MDP7305998.1 response regulator transcription factor [Roseibacillus sp.]MDP7655095.1 response regulator transcription factor [Roseibacillus sp.]|tara:strand:+ start:6978 stop:7640 length:663 start_codon:yes stop_codon:yes gene_type:complete
MTESSTAQIRVWLVEDNEVFRRNVQRVINGLEEMICDGSFDSAESSFAALHDNPAPDVILLDVQLPGIDGIAALGKFKEVAPDTRVIILTVFDDAAKIFRAVCAGASGYVLKASGTDKIGDSIRQVMRGGAPMTPEVAKKVLDAFANSDLMPGTEGDYGLTAREQEILRLLAEGMLKKEIADALSISVNTVSTHLRRVYDKLHVNTNTGAVAKALREGII